MAVSEWETDGRGRTRWPALLAVAALAVLGALLLRDVGRGEEEAGGAPLLVEEGASAAVPEAGAPGPGGSVPAPGAGGRPGSARPAAPRPARTTGIGGRLQAAPLDPRAHAVSTWTGEELLVWGGFAPVPGTRPDAHPREQLAERAARGGPRGIEGEGARYDPATSTWRPMSRSRIAGRLQPAQVWAGDRWFLWSGWATSRGLGLGGATYDPAEDRWAFLPLAPIPPRAEAITVWTGSEVLVVGGVDGRGPRLDGAAFEPGSGTWRVLPPAPLPEDGSPPARVTGAWTGEELVVLADGRAVAYDPEGDAWRPFPSPPRSEAATPDLVALDGGVAFAPVYPRGGRVGYGLVHRSGGHGWRAADLGPLAIDPSRPRTALAAGPRLVVLLERSPDRPDGVTGLLWTPGTGAWAGLPALATTDRFGTTAAWTGAELLIWGGADGEASFADGARWRP